MSLRRLREIFKKLICILPLRLAHSLQTLHLSPATTAHTGNMRFFQQNCVRGFDTRQHPYAQVLDETSGASHARKVIELMSTYNIMWQCTSDIHIESKKDYPFCLHDERLQALGVLLGSSLQDQQYVMRLGSASCAVDELAVTCLQPGQSYHECSRPLRLA